jgi:hypothetical protein
MYRIREEPWQAVFGSALFFVLHSCSYRVAFQDIISTFRAFYFVLYGGGATGSCSVEYQCTASAQTRLESEGPGKLIKISLAGAHWACFNGFMYQKGRMVVIVHRLFVFVFRW